MQEHLDMLEEIYKAEEQIASGEGIAHEDAKALLLRRYGSPDFLEVDEIEKPAPAGDEVLVRVHAVSINDWDWALILGTPFIPNRLMTGLLRPKIVVGSDIAGRVETVGSKVTRFKPGDEVFGDLSGCGFGGFAEFVCAPESALMFKPPKMSFEQAAAIPQAGMLALQGIAAGQTHKPGQTVLINGAGGGVGSIAIQLLKLHQVEVTGVDAAAKLEAMKLWGYDHVIDYAAQDFTRSGKRYDLILDVKTDRPLADYEHALNPHGVYATVGGQLPRLLQVACSRFRFWRTSEKTLSVVALKANRDLHYFNELFGSDKFKPVIDSVYAFSEADVRKAFHHFGTSAHKGKIVVST
ncbi:MAG: NAD(P)-dependent alcohol dehydrogenase [Natronospirillum sp.]|uniref:NAD(P)-dependent alcohol dehydrogenase n=1 Tax=Natronospirillum sp. TaxID=2812955 RepID=UPI0025E27906|nr:NAD(P)-dependent alcohol dehydrogenase [Natronospirillum sp.]MCH8551414.1 NAD(P)-dependent alcohol dehydrogenase [Natronospirillum sp.]